MYFTPRSALIRNIAVAIVNGVLTYVILIIAPLGLMAVIVNSVLVAVASFATATGGDRLIQYLMADQAQSRLHRSQSPTGETLPPLESQNRDQIDTK